jgi:DNA-binding XRE family transcriptional regulator
MRQSLLAKGAEVSPITVFRHEKGEVFPSLETAQKYASVLEVSVESLLGSSAMLPIDKSLEASEGSPEDSEPPDVPRRVARLLSRVGDVSEDELTALTALSKTASLRQFGVADELELLLLTLRVSRDYASEDIDALQQHMLRRSAERGLKRVDLTPGTGPRKPKKR